jgi:hypothetical protein
VTIAIAAPAARFGPPGNMIKRRMPYDPLAERSGFIQYRKRF